MRFLAVVTERGCFVENGEVLVECQMKLEYQCVRKPKVPEHSQVSGFGVAI